MKLQCSCGAKYSFDVKPEMLDHPVKFICPSCGLDASEFVNGLIRQELGAQSAVASNPPPPAPSAPPAAPPVVAPPRMKIAVETSAAANETAASTICAKHRQPTTEKCAVCHKPICPKCLEMFGYFCSPLCKGKAQAEHLKVPVYAGRGDVVEAAFWRKTGLIAGVVGLFVVGFFALWIWYSWFGSVPHTVFSVRFEDSDRGYYGSSQLVGKDQIIFLHGGTLARYDLKSRKAVWTQELITKEQIDELVRVENEAIAKLNEGRGLHFHGGPGDAERSARQALQSQLALRVSDQNIWVETLGKLRRYDWDTGKQSREVTLPEMGGDLVQSGDELQMIGASSITHVSLVSGEAKVEQFGPAGAKTMVLASDGAGGGMPGAIADNGQPMDPKKVAAQAQNLKLQGQIALPALVANAQHEKQLEAAMQDDLPRFHRPGAAADMEFSRLVPGGDGFAQFSWRLLEQRTVTRSAMKAPPKKSALDGEVNAAKTTEMVNEQLNEMQRNSGNDIVTEDQSRYQVTVGVPDATGVTNWTGEVVGPPQLFVLKTVNVIAAGKDVIVLDKSNKKQWQATLTYTIPGGAGDFSVGKPRYGEGPCVERGNTLYVFDQAVLTAFDLATGNARWRLPSVGVVGLFFDERGNVYVNTTTGNPDDIRYARQIDISRHIQEVVTKVDAQTGRTLWSAQPGGFVSYLAGDFIYVIDSYDPNPKDAEVENDAIASLQKPPYLKITRLRPSNGRTMWDYYDRDRCPVNWNFENNSIELIFKREVQVLHYLAL